MQMSQMHYLPMAPAFFAILVGIFFIVLILRSVSYAYESLGVSHRAAMWLLFASLVGSLINIPIAELPAETMTSDSFAAYYGMQYAIPLMRHPGGTVIAINVGGAVIPTLVSIYLLIKNQLWTKGLIATAIVAVIMHWMANPVPGLGIAVPVFVPVLATAVVAMLLSRRYAAPLAYVAGSLGTLIGADISNLDKVSGLGAPVASIGGAGTFDGIFLTGILAVLLASFYAPPRAMQAG